MPYISQKDREKFFDQPVMTGLSCQSSAELYGKLDSVVHDYLNNQSRLIKNVGELNYVLTKICHGYLQKLGMIKYQRLNDIMGALAKVEKNYLDLDVLGVLRCAELEFYRRIASPYEDTKIIENGDV